MAVLSNQVAIVTGGGSGIGLGCARALATDGATVVLAGRDESRLAGAVAELAADDDVVGAVETVRCDVTDEQSVVAAMAAAAEHGPLRMLVANAGYGSASPFEQTTLDDWNGVIGTNLTGVFLAIRSAVPHLRVAGGGSIVAVSSIAGVATHRFMTPYAVSKAGLEMLVRQVADELGEHGIRANAVRPSLVPTDATAGLLGSPEIVHDYLDQMPLGRPGTADEVGALVRFLAGPESGWITGEAISIDGGHHLRRGPRIDPVIDLLYPDR
ncbi:MAG: SDR family NAD(P)-dependent oxidoreductase [Actinomycetota bacterium]